MTVPNLNYGSQDYVLVASDREPLAQRLEPFCHMM
jgi:hypothetical protein